VNAPDRAVFLADLKLFHVRFPAPVRAPGNLTAGDADPVPGDHALVANLTSGHAVSSFRTSCVTQNNSTINYFSIAAKTLQEKVELP